MSFSGERSGLPAISGFDLGDRKFCSNGVCRIILFARDVNSSDLVIINKNA